MYANVDKLCASTTYARIKENFKIWQGIYVFFKHKAHQYKNIDKIILWLLNFYWSISLVCFVRRFLPITNSIGCWSSVSGVRMSCAHMVYIVN